jgi:hypothetical protein
MPPTEDPWASVNAFTEFVGRCREIGGDEFVFADRPAGRPRAATFERIATEVIPVLRVSARGAEATGGGT